MKVGDRFIAERFDSIIFCPFHNQMNEYIDRECEVLTVNDNYSIVQFDDRQTWSWLKSALKPIKSNGFYAGQKVYSHLFPTDDCSGVVKLIYNDGDFDDVQIYIGDAIFAFSKDGRYSELGGICLFDEPIERPKPRFEYGELVWASENDYHWRVGFFIKEIDGRYKVAFVKGINGDFSFCEKYRFIKKYE